jgi:hypothetical protein
MQIVHLGTKVEVKFGVLHESGDVTDQVAVPFLLPALTAEAFAALLPHIEGKRQEMGQQADAVYGASVPEPEKQAGS